jgi:hypothetical protein
MAVPLLLQVAIGAQIIPGVALAVTKERTRAAAALAIGGAIGLLGDIAGRWMAHHLGNNHITTYIDTPVMTVFFLAALREWQLTEQERRGFSIGIILFLLSCVGLVAFVEDIGTFNFGIGPLSSLSFLAAGIWTLLRRTGAVEQMPVQQTDWFWVSLGLAIQGGATALASPLGGVLVERGRLDLLLVAWKVRGVFMLASYLLIGWGIYRGPAAPAFATGD